MGLASLNAALSGLRVTQQQINTISTNVANVGTPGYSRKILPQSTQAINGVTVGVDGGIITRNVDITLRRDLWTQTSRVESLGVKASYLNRIGEFHGPPDRELSVAAEISRLRDSFSELSDNPSDNFLLASTVDQAIDTANKINEFSSFITQLRNDAQDEIQSTVNRINDLLVQIAELNDQVEAKINQGQTTAQIEDERDLAIKELSGLIDISFFQRGDGVLVIQTNEGVELASDRAQQLTFNPSPLSATTFYPDSAAGIFISDPNTDPAAVDVTPRSPGGKLGGLIDLRDETFPKQMAQLDEVAHKMALRLDAQGLRLFTDSTGSIPSDDPPDLTVDPPIPVAYVGFSSTMQVNEDILNDNSLLQSGTYGATPQSGSNEIIRRAVEFGFGDIDFQQAIGDIDLRVSTFAPPNNTMQEFLGLSSENLVEGTRDLDPFASPADLITLADGALDPPNDVFRLRFEEPDLGLGPVDIDVSMAAIPDGAGNFAQDLINYINGTVIPALPAGDQADLTAMNVQFAEGGDGQFRMTSEGNITVDATTVANGMTNDGLAFLGLTELSREASDPYFDVQIGNSDPVRITIAPGDDENDLLAQLNAVPGLAVEDLTISPDGFLRLRPGDDYTNPDFGGDLRIIAGPFTTSGAGANAVFGAGTIPDGINIVSSLFGSFNAGPPVADQSPIENIAYQSETQAGSGVFVSFRENFLGPSADITTKVVGSSRVIDFSQKMVNQHTQELLLAENQIDDEDTLREIIERQLQDDSGVNLDEELGNLIVQQTAYAANARVINVVDELFQELLNAVR